MKRVFFAEFAILVKFKSIRVILFIFIRLIVAVLAFSASKRYGVSHILTPQFVKYKY